jgi:PhzF family phenazine biosynthesis protein
MAHRQRSFKQVDVFTSTPYFGNPLAVVLDGEGLSDADLQRFAGWTNLSETTFVLPPMDAAADYRVRIFTPGGELPFAGHPTLGTCHAWLQAGGKARDPAFVVQECAVGLVRIRRDSTDGQLAFAAPPLKRSAPEPEALASIVAALGLKAEQVRAAQLLDNGPVWLGLLLDNVETVMELTPDHGALERLKAKVGAAAIHARPGSTPLIGRVNREAQAFASASPGKDKVLLPDLEVRAFAAGVGIPEDPVTGSLNASLAQWLMADGYLPDHYLASQGVSMGRAGEVYLSRDTSGQVWVGGLSVTCIDGRVLL